jgi:hypothetical protein
MDDKLTIFIAVTAAAVVLQMLILAAMFFTLRKLSAFAEQQGQELSSRVLPLLEQTKKLTTDVQGLLETARPKVDVILDNASVISTTARGQTEKIDAALTAFTDRARLQAIRVDEIVTRTFDRVEDTSAKVQHTVLSPFKHLNGVLQGIGIGLETLFQKSGQPRNGKHNDEMFI